MDADFASRWASPCAWIGVAAMCLLPAAAGCMCNKGIELRGDWGVQLNHVPWEEAGCHDCGPGGCTAHAAAHGPHEVSGPPPIAPVHRFHAVPTAPVTHPQPAIEAESAPAPPTALQSQPQSAIDAGQIAPMPEPSTSEAVSVLRPYNGTREPDWVFRSQPTQTSVRAVPDRRSLSSGWQPTPTRR